MEVFDQLYAIILFTLLVLFYTLYSFTRSLRLNSPPSPPKLPVIGNLHQLGRLPHRSLWDLSKEHGPMMLLHLGTKPALIISSADAAREILKTHDLSFASRPELTSLKRVFYDMQDVINLPYGDKWRKLRSIFVHRLLSSTRVKSFHSVREEETALLVGKIKQCCLSASPVNLTDMFFSLTNDMISRAAFGKKYSETQYGQEILDLIQEIAGLCNFTIGEFVPWLGWINWLNGLNAALDRCTKRVDQILDAVIDEHLNRPGEPDESKENFLEILLDMYRGKTPGVSIDRLTVKTAILDVFGAGTETSATALTWVMTAVIKHPDVMKKLQDEVREVMKGKQHITNAELEKMQYLKAVVKETFRYYPTISLFVHASREYVNINGYDIPPETMVIVNALAIAMDPTHWQEPEKYMPERFLNCSVDFRGMNFELIPFGAGRRICPGLEFAAASIEHAIANLVHKFDWAVPGGAKGEDLDVTEKTGLTCTRKTPLILVPTKSYF